MKDVIFITIAKKQDGEKKTYNSNCQLGTQHTATIMRIFITIEKKQDGGKEDA